MPEIRNFPNDFKEENYVIWVDKKGIGFSHNNSLPKKFKNWFVRFICNFSFFTGCSYKTSKIWKAFQNQTNLSSKDQKEFLSILKERIQKEKNDPTMIRYDKDIESIDVNSPETESKSKNYSPVTDRLLNHYFESLGITEGYRICSGGLAKDEELGYRLTYSMAWDLSTDTGREAANKVFDDLKARSIPGVTLVEEVSETKQLIWVKIDESGHDRFSDFLNLLETSELSLPPPPLTKPLVLAYLKSIDVSNANVELTPYSVEISFSLPKEKMIQKEEGIIKQGIIMKEDVQALCPAAVPVIEQLDIHSIDRTILVINQSDDALKLRITTKSQKDFEALSGLIHNWNEKSETPIHVPLTPAQRIAQAAVTLRSPSQQPPPDRTEQV